MADSGATTSSCSWLRSGELDKQRPVVVYCATGYRASLAASILQQEGFPDVRNLPGSFHAWKAAKLPVEK
jgi:hydroxyacylglutathione hydrolase